MLGVKIKGSPSPVIPFKLSRHSAHMEQSVLGVAESLRSKSNQATLFPCELLSALAE